MEKKLCDCVYQSILPEISSLNELSLNIKLLKKNEQLIFTMENKQSKRERTLSIKDFRARRRYRIRHSSFGSNTGDYMGCRSLGIRP